MPSRPTFHYGTAASPRTSSNAVNDVVSAVHRKLTANHIESNRPSSPAPRRSSFSMENIFHHKKDKKHDQPDRAGRNEKRKSAVKATSLSRDRNATKSPQVGPSKSARFEIVRESGPLLMLHNAQNSQGALMSEKIKLHIDDPSGAVTLTKWTITLRAVRKTKKPISKDCPDCITRYDVLRNLELIQTSKTYKADQDNSFPFSFLFDGHLPASTDCQLGSLSYELLVEAITSTGENLSQREPITLQRALPEGPPKSSIRIFPPTNLTGRVTVPPIVHPIGKFNVEMKMSGVVEKKGDASTRWRLRKLVWRVEEHSKVISMPCLKHEKKVVSEGKALQLNETRTLGNDELKTGWKSDFDTAGGEIWCEFEASVATKPSHKAVCDVDSPSGLAVWHNLVIELIVAEEFVPNRNTQLITPTGSARVLRMQFALVVTERSGMGISWEDEQPPMYEDVPVSPPGYGSADPKFGAQGGAEILDYEGEELEYTELERMPNQDPNAPPVYRERPTDINSGLPLRLRPRPLSSSGSSNGEPSGTRRQGWTEEELFNAEPQHLRRRESSEPSQPEEDYGEGISGTAPQ